MCAAEASTYLVDAISGHTVERVKHRNAGCDRDDGRFDECPETDLNNVPCNRISQSLPLLVVNPITDLQLKSSVLFKTQV